jgi:hypothetical protein
MLCQHGNGFLIYEGNRVTSLLLYLIYLSNQKGRIQQKGEAYFIFIFEPGLR